MQKVVLVSSDLMMYVVCLPIYNRSYPRSVVIGSHMPREQLGHKNLHTSQVGDVVWREELVYMGGITSVGSSRCQDKNGRQADGYNKRNVSGFKKNKKSSDKADIHSDTVIETFALPAWVAGHTVNSMVVGQYVVAMELHSPNSGDRALGLVDMTGQQNLFQR